jgi:hypothetical protein
MQTSLRGLQPVVKKDGAAEDPMMAVVFVWSRLSPYKKFFGGCNGKFIPGRLVFVDLGAGNVSPFMVLDASPLVPRCKVRYPMNFFGRGGHDHFARRNWSCQERLAVHSVDAAGE